jgi:hypothetical protein
MAAPIPPERIEGIFDAHRPPSSSEYESLLQAGVPAVVDTSATAIRAGYVLFVGPASFEFEQHTTASEEGTRVLLFLVRDATEQPIDIVAWDRLTGRTGTWLNRAWALGQNQLLRPRLTAHGGLSIWRDPLQWLCEGQEGLVLIRSSAAAYQLDEAGPLVVDTVRHGAELRQLLTRRGPRILVRSTEGRLA